MCLLLRIGIIDDRTAKVRIPCISTLYKCFDDSAGEKTDVGNFLEKLCTQISGT